MENLNKDDLRNVMLPMAVGKPNFNKKLLINSIITFYIMVIISYFTKGLLTQHVFVETMIAMGIFGVVYFLYDYFYIQNLEEVMDLTQTGVVIGFSNKILVLSGENVLHEVDADEIEIRNVLEEESEIFFPRYTSIIDCKKEGKTVKTIGIDKIKDYEGIVLFADKSRVNEDIEIVYDDDEDFDEGENDLNDE